MYLVLKTVTLALIIVAVAIIIFFYNFVLGNFVLRILGMYEHINIKQIKSYSHQCYRYKSALLGKDEPEQKTHKKSKKSISRIEADNEEEEDQADRIIEEDSKLLPEKIKGDESSQEWYLSFESKPTIKKLSCSVLVWVVFFGILSGALLLTYNMQAKKMK